MKVIIRIFVLYTHSALSCFTLTYRIKPKLSSQYYVEKTQIAHASKVSSNLLVLDPKGKQRIARLNGEVLLNIRAKTAT